MVDQTVNLDDLLFQHRITGISRAAGSASRFFAK
jgi:hypothetical protein